MPTDARATSQRMNEMSTSSPPKTSGNTAVAPAKQPVVNRAAGQPGMDDQKPRPSKHRQPVWKTHARNQLRKYIGDMTNAGASVGAKSPLQALTDTNPNEANTKQFVHDFLREGLGYATVDIHAEQPIRSGYADFALMPDGAPDPVALIEVKRAGRGWQERTKGQVEKYANERGVRWAIITNAERWMVLHVSKAADGQVAAESIIDVDLSRDDPTKAASELLPITKPALIKGKEINETWRKAVTLSPGSIVQALLSRAVLKALRAKLHSQHGLLLEVADIKRVLSESVISTELRPPMDRTG